MTVTYTKLKDVIYIKNEVFEDGRGYFLTSYNKDYPLLTDNFIQDNESMSGFGVLRGLHYQKPPYAQSKLIRVIRGEIMDVIVDIRLDSPTFGQSFSLILNDENKFQLYVPRGFAHGFLTLQKDTIVQYKVDNVYNRESESGIIYNDTDLNINWVLSEDLLILSEKDKILPTLKETVFYMRNEHMLNPKR